MAAEYLLNLLERDGHLLTCVSSHKAETNERVVRSSRVIRKVRLLSRINNGMIGVSV